MSDLSTTTPTTASSAFPRINLDKIIISETRVREVFKETLLIDLAEDIYKNGLYHPPILTNRTLVTGERRLRAIRLIFLSRRSFMFAGDAYSYEHNTIPYIPYGTAPANGQLLEIELNENLLRAGLTWREEAKGLARLYELNSEIAAEQDEIVTMQDVAEIYNKQLKIKAKTLARKISWARMVVPFLDDPMLAGLRSLEDAFKLITKKLEGEFYTKLLKPETIATPAPDELVTPTSAPTPTPASTPIVLPPKITNLLGASETPRSVENLPLSSSEIPLRHTFHIDNFLDVHIPTGHFDLIIADPPYGIDAHFYAGTSRVSHTYEDTEQVAKATASAISTCGYRWLREQGHLFMFCDIDRFAFFRDMMIEHNWQVMRTPLIWHHPNRGFVPWARTSSKNFRREYETILFACKGQKPLQRIMSDILTVNKEHESTHGARKPPALYQLLMELTCTPGSNIIDPTCGSGPIFPAATAADMYAWGIEQDPEIAKLAAREHAMACGLGVLHVETITRHT